MNILIAPDKFKGSLSAIQVCDAVASAIVEKHPAWPIKKFPMADGGEGTCDILTSIAGGKKIAARARDPLFREIETFYGISPDGNTAFIEMASASGLQLLKREERNPMLTSSIGTGDLIMHALRAGVKFIVLGCGGSATNDGGIGMASALGVAFFDSNGTNVKPIGANLSIIKSVSAKNALSEIALCQFLLISDVDNPLHGPQGAAHVFSPQKGATPSDVLALDEGLKNLEEILQVNYGLAATDFAGAGAAGGFPVSARVFLNADMKLGIDFIMEFSGMEEKIKWADLIITGEGKFDRQSLHGKVVSGMARVCLKHNKKLWVICGVSEVPHDLVIEMGIEKVLDIRSITSSEKEAMENAGELIGRKIGDELL
jgi:glycerate 2-kinase